MGVNKVDFGGNTLIDLTGDTLESADQLLKGIIAHAKDGSVITGLMEAGGGGGGLSLPPTITHFAVDTYTTTEYGTSSITCGHSLGVKPTAAIIFSAIPRVVESTNKSYLEACFAFGNGCVFSGIGATGKFDGTVTYAALDYPSIYKKNPGKEMTDTTVSFSPSGQFYSQSFLVITMRWEE